MKKTLLFVLVIVLVLSLAACRQSAGESEDMQEVPQDTEQGDAGQQASDAGQQDEEALLYKDGDDIKSVLSGFDEKYYSFLNDGLETVELKSGDGSFSLHFYASGMSLDDAKTQMESIFGIAFESNDGAYIYNDTANATVYILDVSDDGLYIRYDFFNNVFNEELAQRDYFAVIDAVVPEISADAVEVERAFVLSGDSSEMYIAYEYPEDKLSAIWDDYQQKLGELDNYELVEDDGERGRVYFDNGLVIDTSVDTGWGRMYVSLRRADEE